ncbi:MAG TPA: carboxypeptidase-like regulatory domain-containing protein [Labilithrix sp.]|nr:carboxypeptidase-like regulatory domain-containing protein [Labilithrix sp.]
MRIRTPLLAATSILLGALVLGACGSSGDSEFGDGTSSGGVPGSSSGVLGGGGDASSKPCTGLCLQQKTCPGGGTTTVSGKVFDPAGKVPLYNVIVYVPNAPVAALTSGASCDRCGDVSGDPLVSAITDTSGKFQLTNVPVGQNIPLVVQVGKWRRQLTISSVAECADTPLTNEQTRLPKNRVEGDIPRMALTTGGADAMECFLRKVGLEDGEFDVAGGPGRVHFYAGSPAGNTTTAKFDAAHGGGSFGSAQTFWSDSAKLSAYDIVLLSCEGQTYPATKPQAALDALYDYTTKGGRVFASHWHRFWFDPRADNNGAVMGTAKFGDLGTWNDDNGFDPSIKATVDASFPKGKAMEEWLGNVGALTGGKLPIEGSKKNLETVNPANAQQWITYAGPQAVEYMSFNIPTGVPDDKKCGRAVYSDLHVSSGVGDTPGPAWPGGCKTTELSPQEKALEFMLFDLSSCIQSDQAPPTPPGTVK